MLYINEVSFCLKPQSKFLHEPSLEVLAVTDQDFSYFCLQFIVFNTAKDIVLILTLR